MAGSTSELSSIATVLGDLTRRITYLAERAAASEEPAAEELFAVEAALAGAQRRLDRVLGVSRR